MADAGLIAGEALVGVMIAVPIVATGDPEVMAIDPSLAPGKWAAALVLAAIGAWLYRTATRSSSP